MLIFSIVPKNGQCANGELRASVIIIIPLHYVSCKKTLNFYIFYVKTRHGARKKCHIDYLSQF